MLQSTKDRSTFERSFKVGAVFDASQVFDHSRNLSELVSRAKMDRHPFVFDQQNAVEDQRWAIVERYAAVEEKSPSK